MSLLDSANSTTFSYVDWLQSVNWRVYMSSAHTLSLSTPFTPSTAAACVIILVLVLGVLHLDYIDRLNQAVKLCYLVDTVDRSKSR